MSRRSIRILSKHRPEKAVVKDVESKKRKAEEDADREMEVSRRRQQFQIQNQWVPISDHSSVITSTLVPTKADPRPTMSTPQEFVGSTFRFENILTSSNILHNSPLPKLNWADSEEVWRVMHHKDVTYTRDKSVLSRHPTLHARMRAILLDWLIEVCEVYRLHRETYYLAVDFFDRFLATQKNIQKTQLQLIGITSLFVAAKLEEIYPPKLAEFAYVTDGACTESEILDQELIMLKALKWDLTPVTVNAWLNVYMQLTNMGNMSQKESAFVFPHYSAHAFVQIARLLDLCMLDMGCLQFSYSVLAASALYHMSSQHIALQVSGFSWVDVAPCVQWMSPFAVTIREEGATELKFFPQVNGDDAHNIQTHSVDLQMLEKAQLRQAEVLSSRSSPEMLNQRTVEMLTPPSSSRKKEEVSGSAN